MDHIRLEVKDLIPKKNNVLSSNLSKLGVKDLYIQNAYDIIFKDFKLNSDIDNILEEIFLDNVSQKLIKNHGDSIFDEIPSSLDYLIEVKFKKGVTDNPANSAKDAFRLFDLSPQISSVKQFYCKFSGSEKELEEIVLNNLCNCLIQEFNIYDSKNSQKLKNRFSQNGIGSKTENTELSLFHEIDLTGDDESLMKISEENILALNLAEMKFIQSYYQREQVREKRQSLALPEKPTNVEIEVIAQTWSEHCKHKIFAAEIDYIESQNVNSKSFGNIKVNSLYKEYIKDTTKSINAPWCKSVFSDNAGIVDFDENLNLCIKVETHNSPSALDPYGGAITGILGVNRDILGCGMGAKPVANTDVFCLAPNHWPTVDNKDYLPKGPKAPNTMLNGVHAGVEDGGNKSGIPTVNGAIYFDADYAGKPLVYVGTIGVMPKTLPSGKLTHQKHASPGDLIVMSGGAIGKDGIHGATFSSLDLDETSPTSAVQIGDPLTQKRLSDFIQKARDLELFTSITDNGAGGLSSSVGEMAHDIGGANIDLKLCPLKYPGLSPYEVMISESQERMTFAVAPNKKQEFLSLSKEFGVESTVIGEFNDSNELKVYYGETLVAFFDHHFLHESLPQMKLKAVWNDEQCLKRNNWSKSEKEDINQYTLADILKNLLNTKNIRSKESLVRKYDHEVGGATHVKPFMGKNSSPSDSGAIWLATHGGQDDNAVAVACGLNPRLSLKDPYLMALWAVDETIRNLISVGVDPDHIALLDNFCWPDPVQSLKNSEGEFRLAQLVRSCIGLKEACHIFNTPLVSGKDSMKNNFRGKNHVGEELNIEILPTLLITGMGKLNLNHTVSNHFQNDKDKVYLLGEKGSGLQLSELDNSFKIDHPAIGHLPDIDIEANNTLYRNIYKANKENIFQSIHDVSDGGALCALAECLFANEKGILIEGTSDLNKSQLIDLLFNEQPGRFIISVSLNQSSKFEELFNGQFTYLGEVNSKQSLEVLYQDNKEQISLKELELAWKESLV